MSILALAVVGGLTILVTATMHASGGWRGVASGTGVYMVAVAFTAVAAMLVILGIHVVAH